jgi:hypothetical protein
MGRMEHDTRIGPPSAPSTQMQPSMPVVCRAPAVFPLENALTSRSCTLEYVTAAMPRLGSTGYGQACVLVWVPSVCAR